MPGFLSNTDSDQPLTAKRDCLAGFHLVKRYPQFLQLGREAVGVGRDTGKRAEVMRNCESRADGLGRSRGHLWLHAEVAADVE